MYDIMIVDDEMPAIEQLQDLFCEKMNIQNIRYYLNADEALKAFRERVPDLVFLDIQMPKMNGMELAERIRRDYPHCQMVFVTAYSNYALPAFEWHALDYLLKPIRPERMEKTWSRFEQVATSMIPQRSTEQVNLSRNMNSESNKAVEIQCFGDFSLQHSGERVVWLTAKAEELFAYLVVHRVATLAQIIEDLFADGPADKASLYANTTIYRVRNSLKNAGLEDRISVVYKNRQYRLEMSGVEVDLELFQQASDVWSTIAMYRSEMLRPIGSLWAIAVEASYQKHFRQMLDEELVDAKREGNLEKIQELTSVLERFEL